MNLSNFVVEKLSFAGAGEVFESPDPVAVAKWIFEQNRYPELILWMDDGFTISQKQNSIFILGPGMINLFVDKFYPQAIQMRDELAIKVAKESSLTSGLSLGQLREMIAEEMAEVQELFDEMFPAS